MIIMNDGANIIVHRTKNYCKKYNTKIINSYKNDNRSIIGIILKSRMSGNFKILNKNNRFHDIIFMNTNHIKHNVRIDHILEGSVRDCVMPEDIFYKNNEKIIVVSLGNKDAHGNQLLNIQFENSGHVECDVYSSALRAGQVYDYSKSNLLGFSMGMSYREMNNLRLSDTELYVSLYNRYIKMIYRCYDKNNNKYIYYGAKGIKVCEEWHSFKNYFYDVQNLPGFDRDKVISGELELDKDKYYRELYLNDKSKYIYSPNTCVWLSKFKNRSLARSKVQRLS